MIKPNDGSQDFTFHNPLMKGILGHWMQPSAGIMSAVRVVATCFAQVLVNPQDEKHGDDITLKQILHYLLLLKGIQWKVSGEFPSKMVSNTGRLYFWCWSKQMLNK